MMLEAGYIDITLLKTVKFTNLTLINSSSLTVSVAYNTEYRYRKKYYHNVFILLMYAVYTVNNNGVKSACIVFYGA